MTYKPLETEFVRSGFRFRQIRREGDIAIFHKLALQGLPQSAPHISTFDAGFETVAIGRHDDYEMAGVKIEAAESYPGNEQWGTKGWTYTTLYDAELRYERLLGRLAAETSSPLKEGVPTPVEHKRRPRGEPLTLTIPVGEFSTKELAETNKVDYPSAFLWLKAALGESSPAIKFLREERRNAKGKPSKIYGKV